MRLLERKLEVPRDSFGAHVTIHGFPQRKENHVVAKTEDLADFILPRLIDDTATMINIPSKRIRALLAQTYKGSLQITVGKLVESALSDITGEDHRGYILPLVAEQKDYLFLEPFHYTSQQEQGLLPSEMLGFYLNPYAPEARPFLELNERPGDEVIRNAIEVFATIGLLVIERYVSHPYGLLTRAQYNEYKTD